MEKPSILPASLLSPTHWPTNSFSAARCLVYVAGVGVAFVFGTLCARYIMAGEGIELHRGQNLQLTGGLLVAQLIAYVPLLGAALPLLPYAARRSLHDIGLRVPTLTDLRAGGLGALAMCVVAQLAAQLQHVALHLEGTENVVALFGTTHDRALIYGFALLAVFVAPVVEEVVFRGFVFNAFLRYAAAAGAGARFLPVGLAAVASAIIFALAHGDRTAFFPLACAGVVLSLVYYRTGSLVSSMLTHGTFNAVNVALVIATGGKG